MIPAAVSVGQFFVSHSSLITKRNIFFLLLPQPFLSIYDPFSCAVNKSNFRDLEVTLCVCELGMPRMKSVSLKHLLRCPSFYNGLYLGAVIAPLVA